jgi:hypothetical protein
MALYVFDANMRLEFRYRHRQQVQRGRAKKRRENAAKYRPVPSQLDREWLQRIDREKD